MERRPALLVRHPSLSPSTAQLSSTPRENRLRRALATLLCAAGLLPATTLAQVAAPVASANFLLSAPPPPPPLSLWHAESYRTGVAQEVSGTPAVTLRGYLYAGADAHAPTLLFFNGQNVPVADSEPLYRALAALGPTVLVYDYRGYGFSTGVPDLAAMRTDALQLFDNAAALRPGHPVAVYGFSLGTAVAAYVASQRAVAGLILAAPIGSAAAELRVYEDLLGAPHLAPSVEAVTLLDEPAMVARSTAPLLLLASRADIIVPIAQARQVAAAATTPHRLLELPNALHGEIPMNRASLQAVKAFLATLPRS